MFIRKEPLDISVEFIEQQKERPRSPSEAQQMAFKCKKNVSHFYSSVYAALTNGEASPIYKGSKEILSGGFEMNFHPDVIKDSRRGIAYTEVKVFSSRSLRISCSLDQASNYSYKLLERISAGEPAPEVNYAFFKYGTCEDGNLFRLPNEELGKKLSQTTKFAVVLPLNLLLFMFYNSPLKNQNQKSSKAGFDKQAYFDMQGGRLFSRLSEGDKSLFEQMQKRLEDLSVSSHSAHFKPDDFMLHEIRRIKLSSPKIRVNGIKMQSFGVTCYYLPSKQHELWLKHFEREHKRILYGVNLEDYFEDILTKEAGSLG